MAQDMGNHLLVRSQSLASFQIARKLAWFSIENGPFFRAPSPESDTSARPVSGTVRLRPDLVIQKETR